MSFCKLKALPVMLLLTTVGAAQAALVTPNNTGGDVFTNAGGANQGQAIGSTGWYYNNVRNGATAYSARSRTPFRCDGGQHSAVMADSVPR